MTRLSISLTALLLLFAAWQPAPPTRYVLTDASTLKVTGTSSLHDWHCDAARVTGWIDATTDGSKVAVAGSEIRMRTTALDCKNGTMNGKVREALAADANPTIMFTLSSAEVGAGTGSGFAVKTTGRLTIAGQTRTVTATFQGTTMPDGRLHFTGQLPVKMSDYGIKPPTAMLGTLKTGDDVVVHIDLLAALAGTQ